VSKKSRGFQAGNQPSSPKSSGPDRPTTPTTPTATSRSAARRSSRSAPSKQAQSGFAKYRNLLLIGAAILAVGVVALALVSGASAARYECASLLTPPPGPSGTAAEGPDASAAPGSELGFATRDHGRTHVSSTTRHPFCPPTSGEHWAISGRAPLQRQFYRIGDDVNPGNWLHNLEHGYVVIAYRDELTDEEEAGIREVFETAAQVPSAATCGVPNKVIVVPFSQMSEPFAVLAWDRALLLPDWDTAKALAFANEWQENPQSPETTSC
jgi:Protein of unknown function (DUF3105)